MISARRAEPKIKIQKMRQIVGVARARVQQWSQVACAHARHLVPHRACPLVIVLKTNEEKNTVRMSNCHVLHSLI